jgi:hypothetical protein
MRLEKVNTGQRLPERLLIGFLTLLNRVRVPDIIRSLTYRPELFGKAYNRWLHQLLRGTSQWAVGERELFAAFTSRCNQCPF